MDSIKEIAGYTGASESKIKSMLYRTRNGFEIIFGGGRDMCYEAGGNDVMRLV